MTDAPYTSPDFTITDARYAKGKKVIHVHDSKGGMKGRASWLAEAVGGRWVGRSNGYTVSPAQAERFLKLHAGNFDGGLCVPKGCVVCRTDGREITIGIPQAIKIIDNVLFESRTVAIDRTRPIEQGTILVCQREMQFKPNGKGKTITIRPRDRVWVTNTVQGQKRVGAVIIDRNGKGTIGNGWGFRPETIAEFFTAEPNRQPEALAA